MILGIAAMFVGIVILTFVQIVVLTFVVTFAMSAIVVTAFMTGMFAVASAIVAGSNTIHTIAVGIMITCAVNIAIRTINNNTARINNLTLMGNGLRIRALRFIVMMVRARSQSHHRDCKKQKPLHNLYK